MEINKRLRFIYAKLFNDVTVVDEKCSLNYFKVVVGEKEANQNRAEAILAAKKAVLLYGVDGLSLLLPLVYSLIEEELTQGEIIERSLINALVIIIIAQELIAEGLSENKPAQLEFLTSWSDKFLLLSHSPEATHSEAKLLASYHLSC